MAISRNLFEKTINKKFLMQNLRICLPWKVKKGRGVRVYIWIEEQRKVSYLQELPKQAITKTKAASNSLIVFNFCLPQMISQLTVWDWICACFPPYFFSLQLCIRCCQSDFWLYKTYHKLITLNPITLIKAASTGAR